MAWISAVNDGLSRVKALLWIATAISIAVSATIVMIEWHEKTIHEKSIARREFDEYKLRVDNTINRMDRRIRLIEGHGGDDP